MPLVFQPLLNYATRGVANFPGIYIWGIMQPTQPEIEALYQRVRVDFESGEYLKKNYLDQFHNLEDEKLHDRKFLPLNVGETAEKTISERIHKHYTDEAFKYTVLFDLSLNPNDIYDGIERYNIHWIRHPRNTRKRLFFKTLQINVNASLKKKPLLFFSNPEFINYLITSPSILLPNNWLNAKNRSQLRVITDLLPFNPANPQLNELIIQMIVSRIILKQYFRFTYARVNLKNKKGSLMTKEYEAATKFALEKMGVFTIATAHDSITFRSLLAGYSPLRDTIDFETNLHDVIFNPNNVNPLKFPV